MLKGTMVRGREKLRGFSVERKREGGSSERRGGGKDLREMCLTVEGRQRCSQNVATKLNAREYRKCVEASLSSASNSGETSLGALRGSRRTLSIC